MDPKLIWSIAVTLTGFLFNSTWAYFNLRWEKKIGEKISDLKEWVRKEIEASTYDQKLLDARDAAIWRRLDHARQGR
jgi:hypothetical protein